jgi:hypothetical protein
MVRILIQQGWYISRQRGSHVMMKKAGVFLRYRFHNIQYWIKAHFLAFWTMQDSAKKNFGNCCKSPCYATPTQEYRTMEPSVVPDGILFEPQRHGLYGNWWSTHKYWFGVAREESESSIADIRKASLGGSESRANT